MIVLCGTNRPDALTRKVVGRVAGLLSAEAERLPTVLDLAELQSDLFEPGAYAQKPEWFLERFQQPIFEAEGIVVVVPEYNGSYPGVMKYFIDMLEFPRSLNEVPVAFIGIAAGQFGAVRAVEQLEMVFHYRSAHLYGRRLFIARAFEAVGDDGSVGDYEPRLKALVTGFAAFSKAVRACGAPPV
jgi:chromate reductase, NAD(P)H dehydrogenase (quinone)